jgi:hypothetical protein
MSAGRAAYEAYDAHLGAPIDEPGYVGPYNGPITPWDEVRRRERDAWEAAATAASAGLQARYDDLAEQLAVTRERLRITGAGAEHIAAELAQDTPPDDAAITAWIERNPQAFERILRKLDRIHGGRIIGEAAARAARRGAW